MVDYNDMHRECNNPGCIDLGCTCKAISRFMDLRTYRELLCQDKVGRPTSWFHHYNTNRLMPLPRVSPEEPVVKISGVVMAAGCVPEDSIRAMRPPMACPQEENAIFALVDGCLSFSVASTRWGMVKGSLRDILPIHIRYGAMAEPIMCTRTFVRAYKLLCDNHVTIDRVERVYFSVEVPCDTFSEKREVFSLAGSVSRKNGGWMTPEDGQGGHVPFFVTGSCAAWVKLRPLTDRDKIAVLMEDLSRLPETPECHPFWSITPTGAAITPIGATRRTQKRAATQSPEEEPSSVRRCLEWSGSSSSSSTSSSSVAHS